MRCQGGRCARYPPTDIEHDNPMGCTGEGDVDDAVRWCETCGALISAEITKVAAEEELPHWEAAPTLSVMEARRQRRRTGASFSSW